MKQILLELKNLSLSFEDREILSGISFTVEKGEWIQIKGLNGEGKTTLIKAILQLYPYTGEIYVEGKNVKNYSYSQLSSFFSYVPQRLDNIPNISLFDFLSIYDFKNIKDKIIVKLGLQSLELVSLKEMSLGQLQLSLIAQSLLSEPEILFLDEPTLFLDVENRNKILSIIREYTSSGKTVITVNYDYNSSFTPNRILLLSNKHLYDTNSVIIDIKDKKVNSSLRRPRISIFLGLLLALVIISLFIPLSESVIVHILWCIIGGGVFAFTGSFYQTIFKNPIVSPNTLGVTSGASLGIFISLLLGLTSLWSVSLFSVLGGLFSTFLLILIHKSKKNNLPVLIFGLLYTFLILSLFIIYDKIDLLLNRDGRDYFSLLFIPFILLSLFPILYYSDKITALGIDSDITKVNHRDIIQIKNISLLVSAIALSLVVSQVGIVPMIGLFIPNLVSFYYGVNLKNTLPVSFLVGSIICLSCDVFIRLTRLYII